MLSSVNFISDKLIVPDGVKSIQSEALIGLNTLTYLELPDSLEAISKQAVSGCSNLETVKFGEGLISIGNGAFAGCSSLTKIGLPESLEEIGANAFGDCTELKSIDIPESVQIIGEVAFDSCTSLTSISGGEGLTEVGTNAFNNTAFLQNDENWDGDVIYFANVLLKAKETISGEYQVKTGTTILADSSFENCSELEKVAIEKGLITIGDNCFLGCHKLTEVRVPSGTEKIGARAFYKWEGIDGAFDMTYCDIYIPGGIEHIGKQAFGMITNVWFEGNPPGEYEGAFTSDLFLTFKYPEGVSGWQEVIENNATDSDGNEIAWESYTLEHTHTLTKTDAKSATCTEAGNIAYWTCSDCGKIFSDEGGTTEITEADTVIAAKGHTLTKTDAKDATCTEAGNTAYWTCSVCKKLFSDENGNTETTADKVTIKALGHNYGDPVYKWAEDNSSCTATMTCKNDSTHVVTETVKTTSETTAATCTATGKTVYTATFTNEEFNTQTKTVEIEATGHTLTKTDGKHLLTIALMAHVARFVQKVHRHHFLSKPCFIM